MVHNKYPADEYGSTQCADHWWISQNGICVYRHPDPVCWPAHNSIGDTRPTSGLCNEGTASSVAWSGPWTWTCRSAWKTASCKKNIP
jgi:hypothetical protein